MCDHKDPVLRWCIPSRGNWVKILTAPSILPTPSISGEIRGPGTFPPDGTGVTRVDLPGVIFSSGDVTGLTTERLSLDTLPTPTRTLLQKAPQPCLPLQRACRPLSTDLRGL